MPSLRILFLLGGISLAACAQPDASEIVAAGRYAASLTGTRNDCLAVPDDSTAVYTISSEGQDVTLIGENELSPVAVTWTGSADGDEIVLTMARTIKIVNCEIRVSGDMRLRKKGNGFEGSNSVHQSWCNGTECDTDSTIVGSPAPVT